MTTQASELVALSDTFASRRYFRKFERITQHMARVAGVMEAEGRFDKDALRVLAEYGAALRFSFTALGYKYLMAGRGTGRLAGALTVDVEGSGFPAASEILTMANDAQQAARHLHQMPSVEELKDDMVKRIIGAQEIPSKLQFALSQRLYYEELRKGHLFWARNDPDVMWLGSKAGDRRSFLMHWAVYDTQMNLPMVYLMDVEDSGDVALPKDQRRWPEVQAHLMAQSIGGLKLLTIAQGFDRDFDTLHPKRLRRIHIGPMYSHAFTRQSGPIRDILSQAQAPEGEDWALVWTVEDLESARAESERSGWFSSVDREVFALDPMGGQGGETGATRIDRAIILPQRPYQVLAERAPAGFADARKFVVSPGGRVLSYR